MPKPDLLCLVQLLDGTIETFRVSKQDEGVVLLDLVCDHLGLQERQLFSLQIRESSTAIASIAANTHSPRWLEPEKPLKKQIKGLASPFYLNFRVRFFISDPNSLQHEQTRHLYFLQIRTDVREGRLQCPLSAAVVLASYAVQSEMGDHSPSTLPGYLSKSHFIPEQDEDFLSKVEDLHPQHKGLKQSEAELCFLNTARTLDLYGVELHAAMDTNSAPLTVGLASSGVAIFCNMICSSFFPWGNIIKISFKRKRFLIHLKRKHVQLRDIINTAQNLVLMLSNSVQANVRPIRQENTGEAAVGQGAQSVPTGRSQQAVQQLIRSQNNGPGLSVKQEMARSFPGFFQKEARGKRRFAPYRTKESGKSFLVSFFLLEKQYEKTPKGDEELPLMLAGLGKRSLTIYENMTHSEFSELLVSAYPRLANICGGWMLHKSTGGGGRRSLVVIPPDLHGYTGQQLKAVSGNGRYTMYISPLQEELDTVPLPPEAKEFEKMPKAQCTTCKKMVPLQILPVHIKECKTELVDLSYSAEEENCNEEHEDEFPDSICNQTYKTAECPVCNNAFQVDMIEIHAATCGLRPSDNDGHESSGSVPVGQISSFQSSEEILDWITCQVDETNTFSICVSRTDLFSRGMQQWQRQKKTSPKCRLKVAFFGEAGIDTGALSREFLTEMLSEIENRLFVGGSDKKGKNPVYCLNSLDSNYFRSAGEVMAASLAQGGPCPSFMREWCFRHLCSGDSDTIQVSASDVTDFEQSQLIDRINSASNDNISDLVDDVVTCGYTGIVSLENKDSMIRTVVLHSTMRVIPMLDQLRKGLQLYDLPKIMKTHQDLCLPLFVPGEDDEADAAFLLERSRPVFSEIGSANHQKEVNIINFLQDYLQEIEDSGQEGPSNDISPEGLTVGRIMQWMTGQRHKPVLPSEKKDFVINMQFNHGCDTRHTVCFPTVSACSRTVTFPSAHLKTYTEFKNILTLAICHGQTFDRV